MGCSGSRSQAPGATTGPRPVRIVFLTLSGARALEAGAGEPFVGFPFSWDADESTGRDD